MFQQALISVGIVVATYLFYWRTLKYGLVSDDLPAAERTKAFKKDKKLTYWQSWYWDFRGINNVKRAHALSIGFHALTCVLMYFVFKNLWAVALFMVHPMTMMVSVWLSGRAYSMAAAMALASLLWPHGAVLLYGLSIYWSISALFYPLVFPFFGWTWLPLIIIGGTIWRMRRDHFVDVPGSKLNNESNAELRALKPRKALVFIKTYGYYFREGLFAYRLGLFHKFLYTFGLNAQENKKAYALDLDFLAGLVALALTFLGIIYGSFYVQLGLVWFLVNLAMWCNAITLNQQIAERYVYMPLIGLLAALAYVLPQSVLMALFVYYATRGWWYMPSFMNEYWNVEYNSHEAKDLYYIWVSRGVHRFAEGNFHDAIRNMMQAYTMRPEDFKANMNLFYIALVLNDLNMSKKHLEIASKCVVDGKADEMNGFVTYGRGMIQKIEESLAKDGKCNVDFKDIRLLL